jgi:hypothetical protein
MKGKGTFRSRVKDLHKNMSGAFTLEATLIFPSIMIIMICLIITSLAVYEKVVLVQRAQVIADRIAYTWDNSLKDASTGEFAVNEYTTSDGGDGLYWRMTDDDFLSQFVSGFRRSGTTSIEIGSEHGGSGPEAKLSRITSNALPRDATGTVEFENKITGRVITVKLERELSFPEWVTNITGTDRVSASSSSVVTEPVEFMRTTDLLISYYEKLKENTDKIQNFFQSSN